MSSVLTRLHQGRPVLVSADPDASLRARGVPISGPAALGRLVRDAPFTVREHYHSEIAAGVDVVFALTADTLPRSLAQVGMPFRSAALTGAAVEFAIDAAEHSSRTVLVAGILGSRAIAPTLADRMAEELGIHATRLAAAGCELIVSVGFCSRVAPPAHPELRHPPNIGASQARVARRAAIVSAAGTGLPAWALVEFKADGTTLDGEPAEDTAHTALEAGAQMILVEAPTADATLALFDRLRAVAPDAPLGAMLPSITQDGEPPESIDGWIYGAKRLLAAGARVLGGGTGTTARHLAGLTAALRIADRQSIRVRSS